MSEAVDTAELHSFVEDSIARFRGHPIRLMRLDRKPHSYQSSFAIEQLDAIFEDGTHLDLILKDISAAGMLHPAKHVRPLIAGKSNREIYVYRKILAEALLGTAVCYSAATHTGRQSNWLLLEKVDGKELYQIGDFDRWQDVARWLARMHGRLAHDTVNQCDVALLEVYDEIYWNGWIDRALGVLIHRESSRSDATQQVRLSWLESHCRQAASRIGRLPATIVHGEFYASNVLIQHRNDHIRICPIDWETTGIGTGLIDVAALTSGHWSEEQKQALAMAYFDALQRDQLAWPEFGDFIAAVNNCRLLLAMKWIGWCAGWEPPEEHRFNWVQEAIQMAHAIEARGTASAGGPLK
jgi:thiamine kinase-like enzyme